MKTYNAGLIGCGDYLRWELDKIRESKHFKVKFTFDLDEKKRAYRAKQLNALPVDSADKIFTDPDIKIVLVFTPPSARLELIREAVRHKKAIITTKPFSSSIDEGQQILDILGDHTSCMVQYGRTGDPAVEKLKKIFGSGEIGSLSLYKEDWFHHYPHWNTWAISDGKNNGPFMDAMIHNLNKSRYLVGDKIKSIRFISGNYSQKLPVNDTEMLEIYFTNGASAILFITWAADLKIFDPHGNDREHVGFLHMITDKGWYVKIVEEENKKMIVATKEDLKKSWEVETLTGTPYDEFVNRIEKNLEIDPSPQMAFEDVIIIEKGKSHQGKLVELEKVDYIIC